MNKKKVLVLALFCLTVIFLCGCGESNSYPKEKKHVSFSPNLTAYLSNGTGKMHAGSYYMVNERTGVVYIGFYNTSLYSGFNVCYNSDGTIMTFSDLSKLLEEDTGL